MKRIRVEGESPDLIAGFMAGVEWVNDSAITVVDLDYGGGVPFVVLEDRDGTDDNEVLRLTFDGFEAKE
jgi:hypothetical protein